MSLRDIQVEEEIGAGSFAKVYKGKRISNGEILAIKVVRKGKLNQKILDALESEIEIQSSVFHAHLVHLQEIIRDPDSIYLVMEYCNLGDLSGYLKKNYPLELNVILDFIHQLSLGMVIIVTKSKQFLRLNSFIHRDIKPQNILLSRREGMDLPIVKIGDFGFAKALPISGMTDTLCGSPLYMVRVF